MPLFFLIFSMNLEQKRQRQREYSKKWREKNPDYMKTFRMENKQTIKEYNALWAKQNSEKRTISASKYRARKLQAFPKWLTEDDLWLIEEMYSLAKLRTLLTKIVWHVDHIIPLKGKNVCGLHVPNNLQIIPAIDNYSKKNKLMLLHEWQ